jgi:trehalose-6-phosphatase
VTTPDWTDITATEYQAGRPVCLLVGFDGALVPPDPIAAAPTPAARHALATLSSAPRLVIGLLGDHDLASLRKLVGLPNIRYAGSSGMHLDLGGREVVDTALAGFEEVVDALEEALSATLRWFPGTRAERVRGRLTLHYHGLAAINAIDFAEEVRETLAALGPDCPPLRVRDRGRALEVTLADSLTGADAIDRLAGAGFDGAYVVFAGGAGDAEAVARVNVRGGLTVGVGPGAPAEVAVRVGTQPEFEAGLIRLAGRLTGPAATPSGLPRPADAVSLPATIQRT